MHILLPEIDKCPSWISGREKMTRKYFVINLHERCCRPRWGLNPRPPGLQLDSASKWATEASSIWVFVGHTGLIVGLVILFVLRFYGPVNPMASCPAWSVYLTILLQGRLSSLSVFFTRNWQLPLLNQLKGENDRRKYFMNYLHETWKKVANSVRVEHWYFLVSS